MNVNSDYCLRIDYKKNALENFSMQLKYKAFNKKILLLCDNTININTAINAVEKAGVTYNFVVARKRLENEDKKRLISIVKKCDIIVCFGGRDLLNCAKALANIEHKEIIFVVTTFCMDYFTNYFYDKNNLYAYSASLPTKIYIDENILFDCEDAYYRDGILAVLAYYELYYCLCFESQFNNISININELHSLLWRVKKLYNSNSDFNNKLELMDIIIELGFLLKDFSPNRISFMNFANLIEKEVKMPFGKRCILSSNILTKTYTTFFTQKIILPIKFPNFFKYCQQVGLNGQKDIDYVSQTISNKNLNNKINIFKNQLLKKVYFEQELKVLPNKVFEIMDCHIINKLKALPFVFENNRLLELLGNYGVFCFN